jgi:transposase
VELEGVAQQKCLAHLIRNAAEVAKEKTGRAKQFGQELKAVLRRALSLSASRTEMNPEDYRNKAEAVRDELTVHLKDRTLRDPDNQRLLNGVGAQHDRGHLLRFLGAERIEPTNNRAERDLRPAVVARKVSHCSKNERGARAFEAFASVLHTIRKINPTATVSILAKLISRQCAPT